MRRKYKSYRIPVELDEKVKAKRKKLEEQAKRLIGKNVRIPKIRVINLAFSKTWYGLDDEEVRRLVKFGKNKGSLFTI